MNKVKNLVILRDILLVIPVDAILNIYKNSEI
jgi:hypothetical protein